MKRALAIIWSFLFVTFVNAQMLPNPADNANGTTHDFGPINEVDGPVMHEFIFTNYFDVPIRILNVKASCGCTTPGWSKDEIQPGESGYVQAQYNPRNRPGPFRKSLTITTNASQNPVTVFYIQGNVTPKPRTPEDDYPTLMGGIRVKYRSFNMGKITTQGMVTRTFDVYNASDSVISFTEKVVTPEHIFVSVIPKTLLPKQKGQIQIKYDPVKKNDLGYQNDNIILFTNEKGESSKQFYVLATIEEYFPPMTPEQLAQAPKLIFEETSHDFGSIKSGDVVSTEFTFTNTGGSDLNIRKTKANCGCTVSKPEKTTLKPGESSILKVTFNSERRKGTQHKSVTIFSNDPSAPTQMITIKASVGN